MTNVTSGSSKRTWEGGDYHSSKRHRSGRDHRDRERDEPKDWREVHLKASRGKSPGADDRWRSPEPNKHRASREPIDQKRSNDYRDRPSRRDDRDRENRERNRSRRDRYRDDYRKDSPSAARSASPPRNGRSAPVPAVDDEREEGEISPRPSPPPRRSPSRGHSSGHVMSRDTSIPPPQPQSARDKLPRTATSTQPDMELDLAPSPPPVEDIVAQRRAKRLAILAKYSNGTSSTPTPTAISSNLLLPTAPSSVAEPITRANSIAMSVDGTPAPEKQGRRTSMSNSPPHSAQDAAGDGGVDLDKLDAADNLTFELAKGDEQEALQLPEVTSKQEEGHDQISAADYDPSRDRREDEHKRLLGEVPHKPKADDVMEVEEIEEVDEDDVDDMFAVAMGEPKKTKKVKRTVSKPVPALITTTALLDTAADAEGYYSVILGEQIDGGRYQVVSSLGKGMFANVVRALVLQAAPEAEGVSGTEVGKEVAIKMVRSQESMYRAGLKEAQILQKIRQADPDDKKHIVRLERTFEHRGHLCLVFESMSMNLRDVVKRFGKDVGLNISAVRTYAHQLFLALSLLKKLNIMHADIKPDNILVNERKNMLKLCDLGSASDASENEITPYLVSRFYRAPEIILGVPYDPALDIWSVGCTLYELYTGKILFPGRTNNQMLLLMMELKGRFNSKMLKKAKFQDVYFDEMGGFESVERDKVTGADVVRKVHLSKPSRDLRARLMPPASVKMSDSEMKLLTSFIDLLDKCLALEPSRRITPREALSHPFIRG